MSQTTIEWTDRSWNVVTGCDQVSAGCDHCYAKRMAKRLKAMGNPRYQVDGARPTSGPGFGVTLHPDKLTEPFTWQKPQMVFVNSMSDLFHAEVPTAFIAQMFAVMALAPEHTFQILTKRPQRMRGLLRDAGFWAGVAGAASRLLAAHPGRVLPPVGPETPLPNVWLGVSVESQEVAWRIDWLVQIPAAVRFLSCEPLLGPLDLGPWTGYPATPAEQAAMRSVLEDLWPDGLPEDSANARIGRRQDAFCRTLWVIVGGESGPGFRAVDPQWVRGLRDHCVGLGIPFFFKQWGGYRPKAGGRELDGRTWDEMPEVAR